MRKIQSLAAALLCLLFTSNTYSQQAFSGVFHQIKDSVQLVKDLNWEAFQQKNTALKSDGFQLIDIESTEDEGKRSYHGLWRADTTASVIHPVPGWDSLVQMKRKMVKKGYLMTDIEAYPGEDGRFHFLCVWRAEKTWHKVWKLDSWEGVQKKNKEMVDKYLYLRDVEAVEGGTDGTKFLVIYHQGDRERKGWAHTFKTNDLKTFTTDLIRRQKSGYRMIDFETYTLDDKPVYLAVYRKGSNEDAWRQNLDGESFDAHAKVLKSNQFNMIDFEIRKGTGRSLIPIVDNTAKKD